MTTNEKIEEQKTDEKILKEVEKELFTVSKNKHLPVWFTMSILDIYAWLKEIEDKCSTIKPEDYNKSLKELIFYVNTHGIVRQYFVKMIAEAHNTYGELFKGHILPDTPQKFWQRVEHLIRTAPAFHGLNLGGDASLIGVPIAAFFTLYDGMPSGVKLFGDSGFNRKLQNLLVEWGEFLDSEKSKYVLNDTKHGWLSETAKAAWSFDDFKKPSEKAPYWSSWNDFFHREIKDGLRPICKETRSVTSCNDGFEWVEGYRFDIKLQDEFWLKDSMPYSLTQIFGEELKQYPKIFEGGAIFQTFLGPYNYHRWHAPVPGRVVKTKIINGCYYRKLIVPDLSGSTTSSLPYILHVNTRGFIIIDTAKTLNIGLVCCIPIGMVEVSSIIFKKKMKKDYDLKKGEEMGYFRFGGSSFAVLFEDLSKYGKKLKIAEAFRDLPAPLPTPTGGGRPIQMGQKFAEIVDLKE